MSNVGEYDGDGMMRARCEQSARAQVVFEVTLNVNNGEPTVASTSQGVTMADAALFNHQS